MSIDLKHYAEQFPSLQFAGAEAGILEIIIANQGRLNAATEDMHRDLAQVWRSVDSDETVRVVVKIGRAHV